MQRSSLLHAHWQFISWAIDLPFSSLLFKPGISGSLQVSKSHIRIIADKQYNLFCLMLTRSWLQLQGQSPSNDSRCRCRGPVASMKVGRVIYDQGWDLFGYTGYSPVMNAIIVAFRGTDSHSIYNWAENMHYWKTDYQVPFPGSQGAAVHTGEALP